MKIVDIKAHVLKIPFRQATITTPGFQEGVTQEVTEVVSNGSRWTKFYYKKGQRLEFFKFCFTDLKLILQDRTNHC